MSTRHVIYVRAGDPELRWQLRRAAADRRVTLQQLVVTILVDWLRDSGYAQDAPEGRSCRVVSVATRAATVSGDVRNGSSRPHTALQGSRESTE